MNQKKKKFKFKILFFYKKFNFQVDIENPLRMYKFGCSVICRTIRQTSLQSFLV